MKDWNGNEQSLFTSIGASNHSEGERAENDYYATDPVAVKILCDVEKFEGDIWEPCAGEGHISKVLEEHGYKVISTDLIDRGYCESGVDFLKQEKSRANNIVTNPPYNLAKEFVEKSLDIIPDGGKLAMFLKLTFVEGKGRKQMFLDNPPKTIYVSSSRIRCGKNGNFEDKTPSAVCYAWFLWEKGVKTDTVLKWVN